MSAHSYNTNFFNNNYVAYLCQNSSLTSGSCSILSTNTTVIIPPAMHSDSTSEKIKKGTYSVNNNELPYLCIKSSSTTEAAKSLPINNH